MTNRSNAENDELTRVAKETLRANDRGGYTVPSPQLYPYQWLWDSGFIALGWAAFDEERAWRELEVLFSAQWANGMVPHLIFHRESTGYFPGPDVWRAPGPIPSSGITQPPVLATAVARAPRLPVAELRHDTGHVAAEQRPRAEEYERYLGCVVRRKVLSQRQ